MTLEQLRVFIAVAERGHMTRAASALNMTQSTASAAIAALEARYGAKLFDRVGRGIELSQAGRDFLPQAQAVLTQARLAEQLLGDLAGLTRGRVTIHASQTVASYWLPPRLVAFRRDHPGIQIDVRVGNTAQVARAVHDGEAEIGLIEGAISDSMLETDKIGTDRLGIFIGSTHPLAEAKASKSNLLDAEWVLREPGSGTRSAFEQALTGIGVDPGKLRVVLELPTNDAVRMAVAAGGGATGLSELAVADALQTGALKRIGVHLPQRAFQIVRHRQRKGGRAAEALACALMQSADAAADTAT